MKDMTRRPDSYLGRGTGLTLVVTSLVFLACLSGERQAGATAHQSVSPYELRVGHQLSGGAIARIDNPVGRRMHSGRHTNATPTYNWSGLVQPGSGIEGAEAYWSVPSVQPSSSSLYSSTWVGVDGVNNSNLIQTGTAQDTGDGYYAWWEILPATSVVITDGSGNPAPVVPGDQMLASVAQAAPGTWTIYLEDITQGWYFEQNFSYNGPGTSAEWIEEAPTVSGSVSSLANFGSVQFAETGIYGDFGSSGTTWYGTAMDASNEFEMVNPSGTVVLARPSAPTSDPGGGQDFTDTYVGASIGPPAVPTATISSPHNNYQLSTVIHVNYSARDASSPIAHFDVRYDAGPWNSEYLSDYRYPPGWHATTSRSERLVGTPGSQYCFAVRATSVAGATSAWTPDSCATLPLGEGSLHATAAHEWTRHHAAGYYLNAYATTTTGGAALRLSGAWASQVAVVAARCPSCGVVDVFVNGRLLGHIDTHGHQTDPNVVFDLPTFSYGRVTVLLEAVTPHSRVIIEGLATS